MSKVRVFELAKELDMPSKDLVDLLNELGVRTKNHMSAIEQNAADYVKRKYGPDADKTPEGTDKVEEIKPKESTKKTQEGQQASAPKAQTKPNQQASGGQKPQRQNPQQDQRKPQDEGHQNKPAAGHQRPANSQHGQYLGTATYRTPRPQGQGGGQGQTQGGRPQQGGQRPPYGNNAGGQRPRPNQQTGNTTGTATYRNPRPQGQGGGQGQTQGGRPQQGGQRPPYSQNRPDSQGRYNQSAPRPQGQGGAKPAGFNTPIPQPAVVQPAPTRNKEWGTANRNKYRNEEEDRRGQERRGAEKRGRKKAPTASPLEDTKLLRRHITSTREEVYEDEILGTSKRRREKQQKVKKIEFEGNITVRDLAAKLEVSASDAMKKLVSMGVMANINQELESDVAQLLASEFGVESELTKDRQEREITITEIEDAEDTLVPRPPVVTIMGHVDHGKTSLLDAIREANVTATEAGGITQHIGAYQVELKSRKITFLDTPGHEAFTAMRARGAQATDVAVLVVAADDGVMPQTIEAINHAKAANVPIVVAINKVDRPGANPDNVKRELMEYDLIAEEWGGDAVMAAVSAKQKTGIEELLELILLVADMRDLRANPNRMATGTVIEAKIDKGRGPVATVLINKGTLKVGDNFVAGAIFGKVRAMVDYLGNTIDEAGPSTPVEVLGLNEVPEAGDIFSVVADERDARQMAERRVEHKKSMQSQSVKKVSLEDLFSMINEGNVKDLNIIIKADVQGSCEAIKQSLEKLSTAEVRVNVIHTGVGSVAESDIMLASASNAIIIGFNVRPSIEATRSAEVEHVDVRLYRVIYEAIEDVKKAMVGMLDPEFKEVIFGRAEVRATFRVPKAGVIAGSYVVDGKIPRNSEIRVVRDGIVVHEGKLDSLKRFKDDAKEVLTGFECGIGIDGWNDVKEGDVIEAFGQEEIAREL